MTRRLRTLAFLASTLLVAHAGARAESLRSKLESGAKKVKSAAKSTAKALESAARGTAETASSVAFSAKSISKAAIKGLPHFDKSVRTQGLDTPGLRAMCPGVVDRRNGCSNPLKDGITKQFKKLFFDACQDHDLCYNLTDAKQACDVAFRDRMYKLCGKYSVKKTYGLCKIAAHTWFAAVAHAKEAVRLHGLERAWSRANCKPVPEIATTPIVEPSSDATQQLKK